MRGTLEHAKLYRLCRSGRWLPGFVRVAAVVVLMVAVAAAGGCQVDPVTGRTELNTLTRAEGIAVGQQHAPEYVKAFGGEVDDLAIRQYVTELGGRIAAVSHEPDLPWRFYVVDSSVVNAFAIPGGHVFVTRGLLTLFEDEAELMSVLGHEVAHVVRGHSGQQQARAEMVQLGLIIGGAASGAQGEDLQRIYNIGGQVSTLVFLLPFSREHENQADETGLAYMVKAGYEPRAMADMLDKLARQSDGKGRPLLLFSTHPYPQQRAKTIRQLIAKRYSGPDVPHELARDRYRREVLDRLAKLAPPRHQAQ